MSTFRRRNNLVYAKQFDPKENPHCFRFETQTMTYEFPVLNLSRCRIEIPVEDGIRFASPYDWIIQGEDGELTVLNNDSFNLQYEPINPAKT